jgi:outer membrane protein OmpA-like peptidoglycan-associated protein
MDSDRDRLGGGPLTGRPGATPARRGKLPLIIGAIVALVLLILLVRGMDEADEQADGAFSEVAGGEIGEVPAATATVPPTATGAAAMAYAPGGLASYLSGAEPVGRVFELAQVTFDSGSAELSDAANGEIVDIAAALQGRSSARVSLRGFADPDGDAAANQQLSQQRAEAVRAALIEAGAGDAQVAIAGLGETGNAAVRQNRRVELTVTAR